MISNPNELECTLAIPSYIWDDAHVLA